MKNILIYTLAPVALLGLQGCHDRYADYPSGSAYRGYTTAQPAPVRRVAVGTTGYYARDYRVANTVGFGIGGLGVGTYPVGYYGGGLGYPVGYYGEYSGYPMGYYGDYYAYRHYPVGYRDRYAVGYNQRYVNRVGVNRVGYRHAAYRVNRDRVGMAYRTTNRHGVAYRNARVGYHAAHHVGYQRDRAVMRHSETVMHNHPVDRTVMRHSEAGMHRHPSDRTVMRHSETHMQMHNRDMR